ncbi:hypothetical protein [Actinoplanes sp. NPDC049681]|uniref:hypothetical protein n=1 Tax=Actinoplanes sp. NPDC049681 TaxID=3363905 RepID=UPI00379F4AEF
MSVQLTVGDVLSEEGAVTVALGRERAAGGRRVMIELVAASGSRHCVARLTISEAEVLQTALDSLIFDAAMRSGERTYPKGKDGPAGEGTRLTRRQRRSLRESRPAVP